MQTCRSKDKIFEPKPCKHAAYPPPTSASSTIRDRSPPNDGPHAAPPRNAKRPLSACKSRLVTSQKLPVYTPRTAYLRRKSSPFSKQKQAGYKIRGARLQRQRAAFTLQSQPFQRVKGLLLQAQKAAPATQEDCFCISPTYLSPSHAAHSSLHIPHFSFPTLPISHFTFHISHSLFLISHSKNQGFCKVVGLQKKSGHLLLMS